MWWPSVCREYVDVSSCISWKPHPSLTKPCPCLARTVLLLSGWNLKAVHFNFPHLYLGSSLRWSCWNLARTQNSIIIWVVICFAVLTEPWILCDICLERQSGSKTADWIWMSSGVIGRMIVLDGVKIVPEEWAVLGVNVGRYHLTIGDFVV